MKSLHTNYICCNCRACGFTNHRENRQACEKCGTGESGEVKTSPKMYPLSAFGKKSSVCKFCTKQWKTCGFCNEPIDLDKCKSKVERDHYQKTSRAAKCGKCKASDKMMCDGCKKPYSIAMFSPPMIVMNRYHNVQTMLCKKCDNGEHKCARKR